MRDDETDSFSSLAGSIRLAGRVDALEAGGTRLGDLNTGVDADEGCMPGRSSIVAE